MKLGECKVKLYRGGCLAYDEFNQGELKPKGNKSEVAPRCDGKWKLNGKFKIGETEGNAARAHQMESGLYGGCFVSFTRCRVVAEHYATTDSSKNERSPGYVYVVDEELLEKYGVTAIELPDPEVPSNKEVSLRAKDGGNLPHAIIIEKFKVTV